MTQNRAALCILEQLESLATGGTLPPKMADRAQAVLQRAMAPVVVAVLGFPDSGKSELINLLVGDEILSGDTSWASVKIGYGDAKRTIVTCKDGTRETREGLDLSVASLLDPSDVVIETPSAILRQICLIETALNDPPELLHDTFDQAIQAADIILWCSQEFLDEEYRLWERVPDAKKDHSFMILTKADLLSEQCVLSETIEATQVVVAEEFHSLIPVATVQAVKANQTGDTNALKASGGEFLIKAIQEHVETGRRADIDNATLFLDRHGADLQNRTTGADELSVEAVSTGKVAEIRSELADAHEPMSAAIIYLQQRAETMVQSESASDDKAAFVLEHCAFTSAQLAETILEHSGEMPEIQELVDDVMDAADVILLMQMESGVSAAADAVAVLLQLRRGFEAKIAA